MARRVAPLVAAGTVGLVVLLTVAAWFLWPGSTEYRSARATVVEVVACGPPEARDRVRVELIDGTVLDAELDGCGSRDGEVLDVEVPDPLPDPSSGERPVVRLAGTGVPTGVTVAQRLSAALVVLAGASGGLLAWRLGERP